MQPPRKGDTLLQAAVKVLNTPDPWLKAKFGDAAATLWMDGSISVAYNENDQVLVPDRPARLPLAKLVAPQQMPKLGKGGSLRSRQALLHSLVHIENWAIDLSWDIIARFGKEEAMPREFFDDFVKVAREEGRHFTMLAARLEQLEAFYGSFPVHDGLWDSAASTANDLSARLAIEHCVHEARGLDVMPTTVSRFRNGGDNATAELLESVVYPEEISHCAAGVKWFTFIWLRANLTSPSAPFTRINSNTERIIEETNTYQDCRLSGNEGSCEEKIVTQSGASVELNYTCDRNDSLDFLKSSFISQNVVPAFHAIVKKHFRGPLKPPFNEAARAKAGFGPEWYLPLSTRFSK